MESYIKYSYTIHIVTEYRIQIKSAIYSTILAHHPSKCMLFISRSSVLLTDKNPLSDFGDGKRLFFKRTTIPKRKKHYLFSMKDQNAIVIHSISISKCVSVCVCAQFGSFSSSSYSLCEWRKCHFCGKSDKPPKRVLFRKNLHLIKLKCSSENALTVSWYLNFAHERLVNVYVWEGKQNEHHA